MYSYSEYVLYIQRIYKERYPVLFFFEMHKCCFEDSSTKVAVDANTNEYTEKRLKLFEEIPKNLGRR
jgi:hypothetical protein